jgi:hypothetical protein
LLIIFSPGIFSNSPNMEKSYGIQRDHGYGHL